MKKVLSILLILILIFSLSSCKGNEKEVLTIYTWEAMFPDELLDDFTEKTGIEINYVNFDTNETMLAKLEASNASDYDFIIADDYIVEQAIEKGLVSKLDKSKISTYDNINPIYQSQYYDKDNLYTVPCGAGIMEFAYRDNKVNSYEDLFNPNLKDKIGIIDNPRVIFGMALKINGDSFNTTDTNKLDKAYDKLIELAPNIRLIKDDFLNDDLVSGEIDVAFLYTAQAVTAALTDEAIKTSLPSDGLGFGIMAGFVPENAPNKEAAYKFIEFLNDAENSATWFNYMGYYCTNKAAESYLDPMIKDYVILPDNINKEDMEMIENIPGEVYSYIEELWTKFKNECAK